MLQSLLKLSGPSLTSKVLTLSAKSSPGSTPSLEAIDILRLLPASMKHVELGLLPLDTAYLLNALGDPQCVPALKTLSVEGYVRSGHNDNAATARPRRELENVANAGKRRGVELEWGWMGPDDLSDSELDSEERA